jgi:hypothetical protein
VGIFFASDQPVVPEVHSAIRDALLVEPHLVKNADEEASHRTLDVVRATAGRFKPLRFFCALLIAGALFAGAVWTARQNMLDISKQLMVLLAGFSGIVVGLLVGEAQKSTS